MLSLPAKEQTAIWLRRLGLYRPAVAVATRIGRLRFRLAPDTGSVSIRGARADFWVKSQNEFSMLRTLPEREVLTDIIATVKPDDTFYDIGANVGLFACLVASVVDSEVVAFEPEPKNADRLRENVRLNGADIDVYDYALSDANERRTFAVTLFDGTHQTGPAGHSFVTESEGGGETIEVEAVIGDEFIERESLPVPNVVKIDVEGAEWSVLSGLESTLSHPDCRVVYCEVHGEHLRAQGRSVQDVLDTLTQMGFDVELPFTPYGEPFIRAEKGGTDR